MSVSRYEAMIVKESNGKNYWTRVGVMFPNKNGAGFQLYLDAIPAPVDGAYKISLFEPKENNNQGSNNRSDDRGSSNSSYSSGRPGANRNDSIPEDDIPF